MAFKKGESGNLAGRPKGRGDKRTELRKLLDPHAPEVIDTLINLAKGGDTTAIKLVLDRTISVLKASSEQSQTISLAGDSLKDKGDSVLRLIANGEITIDESTRLMVILSMQAKLVELNSLEERLTALEDAK